MQGARGTRCKAQVCRRAAAELEQGTPCDLGVPCECSTDEEVATVGLYCTATVANTTAQIKGAVLHVHRAGVVELPRDRRGPRRPALDERAGVVHRRRRA